MNPNRHLYPIMNSPLNKQRAVLIIAIAFSLLLAACSEENCPLSSKVYSQYAMKGDTLRDTLTVITMRPDSNDAVVLNRLVNTYTFYLPMSYQKPTDELLFLYTDAEGKQALDTVRVNKTDKSHFESVDCPPSFFHTITSVECTKHRIDSIVIHDPNVDYDETKQHLYIYFNSRL